MTYILPPLNALRAFEAAARHLSFKLAAHELHVTPAAVGQQVKALETRLGVRLFERLHKQLILTAAGHRVPRRAALPAGLTRREVEVLVLLARGLSNPQIATELTISRKTVSSHLEHIYSKLGVRTRTEAALYAMQNGLVDPLDA